MMHRSPIRWDQCVPSGAIPAFGAPANPVEGPQFASATEVQTDARLLQVVEAPRRELFGNLAAAIYSSNLSIYRKDC